MRLSVQVLCVAAISSSVLAGGVIEGTVSIKQGAAKRRGAAHYAEAPPAKARAQARLAVVYAEALGAAPEAVPPSEAVILTQKNFSFVPALLPVLVGTRVAFPNEDPEYHNVFSYSSVRQFDLGRYRKDENPPVVLFDKPGEVKLFCEIHKYMRGTILVLETPYFVVTGDGGAFRMAGLPAGAYKLKVWDGSKTSRERAVTVVDNATLKVDFPEP